MKRLIASVVIGGREAGYDRTRRRARSRRAAFAQLRQPVLRQLVELSPGPADTSCTSTWNPLGAAQPRGVAPSHLNADAPGRGRAAHGGRELLHRTTEREPDGKLRFVENPPTMVRFRLDDATPVPGAERPESIHALFAQYRQTR